MKKKVNIKIIIFSIVIILLVFLGYNFLKLSSLEFNKYIELSGSPSRLYFFEKRIEGNKIFYSHVGELDKYIGEIVLVRKTDSNNFISNSFETNLSKISDKKLDDKVSRFLGGCLKMVKLEGATVTIYIENDSDVELKDDMSLEEKLRNNIKINYAFQDKKKMYVVNIRKNDNDVIGTFSYNGEINKVKPPEELSLEEVEESYKDVSTNLGNDNGEFGVG